MVIMTEEELLNKLKKDVLEIKEIDLIIEKYREKKSEIYKNINTPCHLCNLDGLYRCEACELSLYEGFNDPDWY